MLMAAPSFRKISFPLGSRSDGVKVNWRYQAGLKLTLNLDRQLGQFAWILRHPGQKKAYL